MAAALNVVAIVSGLATFPLALVSYSPGPALVSAGSSIVRVGIEVGRSVSVSDPGTTEG